MRISRIYPIAALNTTFQEFRFIIYVPHVYQWMNLSAVYYTNASSLVSNVFCGCWL